MPRRQVHRVELRLYDLCNVVQHTLRLESERDAVNSMLLHLFAHVTGFDDRVLCSLLVEASVGLDCMLRVDSGSPFFGGCNSGVSLC